MLQQDIFTPLSRAEVAGLGLPVLLVKGEHSPSFLTSITDTLNNYLPNSRIIMIPESSHGLQLENPHAFNQVLLEFLENLPER